MRILFYLYNTILLHISVGIDSFILGSSIYIYICIYIHGITHIHIIQSHSYYVSVAPSSCGYNAATPNNRPLSNDAEETDVEEYYKSSRE